MKKNLVKILSAITLATTLTFSVYSINNITIAQEEYKEKPSLPLTNIKVKLVDDKLYFYAPDFANKTVRTYADSIIMGYAAVGIIPENKIASDGLLPHTLYFDKYPKYIYIEDETASYSAEFSHDEILNLLKKSEDTENPKPNNSGTPVVNNSTNNTTNTNKEEDKKETVENKTTEDKKENSNTPTVQQTKNLPKTSAVK